MTELQTSYAKRLQKGLPGMLARPNAPHDYDLAQINEEMEPGMGAYYSASDDKWVLPTSSTRELVTHIVSYDPTSFNSDISAPTTNNLTEVVFDADAIVKMGAFGSFFAVAGEALENADQVVYNETTEKWIKYDPVSGDQRVKSFEVYMDPGKTAVEDDIIEIRVSSRAPVNQNSQTVKVSLTNAQIKAMRATPVELVSAQGANTLIVFEGATLVLNAGSEVLTESADNMAIEYDSGSAAAVTGTIEATNFIDQAADTVTNAVPAGDVIDASADVVNKNIALVNTGDGEYAGNASADATMDVYVTYRVLDLS